MTDKRFRAAAADIGIIPQMRCLSVVPQIADHILAAFPVLAGLQGIDIPEVMRKLSALIEKAPSWRAICREREENAERLRRGENKNDT